MLCVLGCGGRDYSDEEQVFRTLDCLHAERGPITKVVEGGYRGADALVRKWARLRGVECATEYAEWQKYGPRAGPIRNGKMLSLHRPDITVAFAGGRGTHDMISQSAAAGVEVIQA